MTTPLGQAFVEIRPDASRFEAQLRRDLASATQRSASVPIGADTSRLPNQLRRDLAGAVRPAAKAAGDELEDALTRSAQEASQNMRSALTAGLAIGGGIIAHRIFSELKRATEAASDLGEATNVTGVVFKQARGEIDEFVKSSTKIGLSEAAARSLTASLGGLLKNQGLAMDQSIEWSKRLTVLGADLGSTFNTDPADAILAIGSALRGEQEPIRRYNVSIDAAAVAQKAVALGLARSTTEVSKQAKTMATLELIMEQTTDAQGDFARTAGDAANAQRKANAELVNAQAALGEGLIPLRLRVTKALSEIATGFAELPPLAQSAFAFGGLALAATIPVAALIRGVQTLRGALIASRTASLALQSSLGIGVALIAGAAFGRFVANVLRDTKAMQVNIAELARATDEELVQEFRRLAAEGQGFNVFAKALDEGTVQARRLLNALNAAGIETATLEAILSRAEAKERDVASSTAAATAEIDALGGAAQDAVGPFERLAKSVDDVRTAIDNALTPTLDAQEAADRFQGAIHAVKVKLDEMKGSADSTGESQRELRDALREAEQAAIAEVTALVGTGQIARSAVPQELFDRINGLKQLFPGLRAEIDAVLERLSGLSHLRFDNIAQLRAAYFAPLSERFGPGRRPKGRQHGGPVWPGEAYIVGERRPELFVPDRPGRIEPKVPAAAASAAPAGPVVGQMVFNEKVDPMHVGAEVAWWSGVRR